MKAETVTDPAAFLRRSATLLADEARHNMILGIVGTLVQAPEVYPEYRLFLVSDGDTVLAAAVITPPFNLVVADAASDRALAELAALADGDPVPVPGVIGNLPTVGVFVEQWQKQTGCPARLQMEQGVFALQHVNPARPTPGRFRVGVPEDRELIERWTAEFVAEALPEEPFDQKRVRRSIARRLAGETPGAYWVWEVDGVPVSLSGHGSPTGRGIRIGPVYTPRELRGNGYASALVAAQSEWLLGHGYDFCFLYTDMANPTSNAIYERIGYQQVADSAAYVFEPGNRAT